MASLCSSSTTSLNDRREIQLGSFEAAFSDQITHPADYFTRATIVLDDVVQNLAHLSWVARIGSEETLGRLGIAANGRERLIQFMRQGSREFAHGGDSRYMGEFVAMALHALTPRPSAR